MIDIDQLPVPDWGLRCPACDAPLAGMPEHRCGRCGQRFNIRQLLGLQRPVPNLGLTCEHCGYLLTGLTEDRCPECGTEFSIREMIEELSPPDVGYLPGVADLPDHHLKRREPTFTGRERPLPDFGLCCRGCGCQLAGATGETCPRCFMIFDPAAAVPPGDWVNISKFIPRSLRTMATGVLYQDGVPYLVDNAGLTWIYGGNVPFIPGTLRIPREFFFDALHALTAAAEQTSASAGPDWTCPACKEPVPGDFDICWSCNTPRPDGAEEEAI
jgi:hypothetical protein